MKTIKYISINTVSLLLLSNLAIAAVPPDVAQRLGQDLTPLGAERAGNADGSIPAWTGGLPTNAGTVDSAGFLADPFADEEPLFVITAANAQSYQDKLSGGQLAMFKRYPDSYRIPVYKSHRTAAVPEEIYQSAMQSALNTKLLEGGNGLANFSDSRYYAFPIPDSGVEILWNHITRYRGGNLRRMVLQAAPQTDGSFTPVKLTDEVAFPADMSGTSSAQAANLLLVYKQIINSPPRLAGNVMLVHENIDQISEPRMAWLYNSGQRRVRRAPQVSYDGPAMAADGMRTVDNYDMFNGAPDRYEWKLLGKQEKFIPYNSYKLASPELRYSDIHQKGHINQDFTRYEPHRVWVIEAALKSGQRHIYAKRTMYFDEDTWMIAGVDHHDGRGQLWRVAEGHSLQHYAQKAQYYTAEATYDLVAGRYITLGLSNEENKNLEYGIEASASSYTPAALRASGIR
ncbi:DUF1329 domain-containing protein [Halopseudomonas bauzanensis]|uniref:DUF1329 domain-containing protein n=1 Tax=Halopseudomonas bauzanensis TaxID=653930 RepID=UPI00255370F9|nr:DUF1329 domain-containing protein [Halopseudomonas bauzanensis]